MCARGSSKCFTAVLERRGGGAGLRQGSRAPGPGSGLREAALQAGGEGPRALQVRQILAAKRHGTGWRLRGFWSCLPRG